MTALVEYKNAYDDDLLKTSVLDVFLNNNDSTFNFSNKHNIFSFSLELNILFSYIVSVCLPNGDNITAKGDLSHCRHRFVPFLPCKKVLSQ